MIVDLIALFVICCLLILNLFSSGHAVFLLSLLTGSCVICIQQFIAAFLFYRYLRKTHSKNRWDALAKAASSPQFFFWHDQDFLNAKEEIRQSLRKEGKVFWK